MFKGRKGPLLSRGQKTALVQMFAILSLGIASSALGAKVEAKKDGVDVTAEPGSGAAVLKTLKAGEKLEAGERKGMYWEVTLEGGKKGYVSVMAVKREAGGDSSIAGILSNAVSQGREENDAANARARSAVMGVRGLDEDEGTAFAGNAKPNLRAVYQMEDLKIDKASLEKLGESVLLEVEQKAKKR